MATQTFGSRLIRSNTMAKQKKIRFALIGCSRIARKSAIPAIIDSKYAELVAVGSSHKEKASSWAKEFDAQIYGSYEEVLKSPLVDAVYISLPNSLHEEWILKALKAKKHVWCEKPTALSYASAKRMVNVAEKNGVRLMEGFMFLSHPQHQKVFELIKKETIGQVRGFEGRFTFPMPGSESNLLNKQMAGGSYNDSAVYPIRASQFIFGEDPENVICSLVIDPKTGVDLESHMIITFPNNKFAQISSSFGPYFQSTYSVFGSQGVLSVKRAYAVPKDKKVRIYIERNDKTKEIIIPPADHFKLMIDQFCQEILKRGKSNRNYEKELLSQARILEAGRRSHAKGRIVSLNEII